jgi:hypothetical protein
MGRLLVEERVSFVGVFLHISDALRVVYVVRIQFIVVGLLCYNSGARETRGLRTCGFFFFFFFLKNNGGFLRGF